MLIRKFYVSYVLINFVAFFALKHLWPESFYWRLKLATTGNGKPGGRRTQMKVGVG